MRTRHRYRIRSGRAVVASVAAGGLLLAACGGGGDSGVATLGDGAAPAGDGSTDAAATEEEMLEYTECLRGQGLDIEDPVIDPNGNVRFGGFRAGGEGPGHRQQLDAAQDVCGEPPGGGFADHGGADQAEHDDAMLELARCMRDEGFDMPDPGVDRGDGDHIDENDPEFQEAFGECRDALSAPLGGEDLPSEGG